MATVYKRLDQPRNVHKMFLTVAIMHLAANDPPAADAAFQEHLQCVPSHPLPPCQLHARWGSVTPSCTPRVCQG